MAQVGDITGDYEARAFEEDESEGSQPDTLHIGHQEAWWILEQETRPFHFPNGSRELQHQLIGGDLVERLSYHSKLSSAQERILNRDWLAFKWGRGLKTVDEVLSRVLVDMFPHTHQEYIRARYITALYISILNRTNMILVRFQYFC